MMSNLPLRITFIKNQKSGDALTILSQLFSQYSLVGSYTDLSEMIDLIYLTLPNIITVNKEWYLVKEHDLLAELNKVYINVNVLVNCSNTTDIKYMLTTALNRETVFVVEEEMLIGILTSVLKERFTTFIDLFSNSLQSTKITTDKNEDNEMTSICVAINNAEKRVLSLLVNGLSYKMIANELSLSVETVKTHMRNIYRKLNVNNNVSAVAKAIRYKLV